MQSRLTEFMSRAAMPWMGGSMPRVARRLTLWAPNGPSWPHAETITLASITLGSMQLCFVERKTTRLSWQKRFLNQKEGRKHGDKFAKTT